MVKNVILSVSYKLNRNLENLAATRALIRGGFLILQKHYGHPLAGLLWELYQEEILLKVGFEKVKSWECLYVHREKQLFLSAYIDDYKMAGKKGQRCADVGNPSCQWS